MKPVQHIVQIFGVNIKTMFAETILANIEKAEADIKRYKAIATGSKYLDKRCAELNEAIKIMVAELDSREAIEPQAGPDA